MGYNFILKKNGVQSVLVSFILLLFSLEAKCKKERKKKSYIYVFKL